MLALVGFGWFAKKKVMAMPGYRGKFTPRNPHKYKGDLTKRFNYRSLWERRAMKYFDDNPNVLEWGDEGTVVIQYWNPVKRRPARYFVDFWIKVQTRSGELKTYIIEVKPKSQCNPPDKRILLDHPRRYKKAAVTFAVNQAKWQAALEFCQESSTGVQFRILTEEDLKI